MADLDDFFAKKDRKKSKNKKFTTAEELAKRIEDTSKKVEEKSRKVTSGSTETSDSKNTEDVDEEWKEFEEERKDYSGLKLAQLNIGEDDHNQGGSGMDDGGSPQTEHDGERGSGEGTDRRAAAWKKVDSSADSSESKQQQQQPQQQQQQPGSNLYVLPAMKNRIRGKKGVAPDLKNEEFFPTLGADQPDASRSKKDSTFEEVKHGGRVRQSDLPSAAPLSVGNRFTSLSNDAS